MMYCSIPLYWKFIAHTDGIYNFSATYNPLNNLRQKDEAECFGIRKKFNNLTKLHSTGQLVTNGWLRDIDVIVTQPILRQFFNEPRDMATQLSFTFFSSTKLMCFKLEFDEKYINLKFRSLDDETSKIQFHTESFCDTRHESFMHEGNRQRHLSFPW